jgi:ATP-binding cassette subfamily B protein/subfamily B ATP-binding cassette protein MsbA
MFAKITGVALAKPPLLNRPLQGITQSGIGIPRKPQGVGKWVEGGAGHLQFGGPEGQRGDGLPSAIGYVTQDSFLFNGNVRDNLVIAKRDATEEELWEVLAAANASGFVQNLPEKLDTQVGERGVRLSVGEKQRISIARALLKNPPILLLDEATASADTETERLIQQALERLMSNRTSLVIAHRLSTVRHADRIYVFSAGEIIGLGTHEELLAENGLYTDFCRTSLMAESEDAVAA